MTFHRFPPNTIVEIDDADYAPQGYSAGRLMLVHMVTGNVFVAPDADGVVGLLTDDQFDELQRQNRVVLRSAPSVDPTRRMNGLSQWTIDQAMGIDPAVGKMLAQIDLLDAAGIKNGDKAIERHMADKWTPDLVAKYGEHDPVRTIRYWRATRGTPGKRHAREMVRMNGRVPRGPYAAEIPSEVLQKHALAHWTVKARILDTYASYVAEMKSINDGLHAHYPAPDTPFKIASKATMRRRCHLLESSETDRLKNGKQKFEQDWMGGGRPLTADFAMQRVIIDHTRIDVHVVDDERGMVLGRAFLTLAICVGTRAIVAHLISFIDPSTWTVGEILRRMALPKRPPPAMLERYPVLAKLMGKPSEVILDNATEFHSFAMEAAARCAGFALRFCPFKKPRYRAIVERSLGTVNRMICEILPGSVLPLAEARRLQHNPKAEACVIMAELEAIANQVIAEYNTSPHDGLNGRQPALMFQRDIEKRGVNHFVDLESFRLDTMAVQTDAQLSPSGIRAFSGLRYHCIRAVPALLDDLRALECRRQRRDDATATVDFRYDPQDISRIHVWNKRTREYVTLRCADESYSDGMPLAFHNQILASAQADKEAFNTEEERLLARARRIQFVRNIDPAAKAKARKMVGDLLEIPRIRRMTGNIVHLQTEEVAVACDDFVANDRAILTAVDADILASRPQEKSTKGGRRNGAAAASEDGPSAAPIRNHPTLSTGEYE